RGRHASLPRHAPPCPPAPATGGPLDWPLDWPPIRRLQGAVVLVNGDVWHSLPPATCAGSRSTSKSLAASAAMLAPTPSPAYEAIWLPCASRARRSWPPAKRPSLASRSIPMCYNSAREKTGRQIEDAGGPCNPCERGLCCL